MRELGNLPILSDNTTVEGLYRVIDAEAYRRRAEPSYSRLKRAVGAPIAEYWTEPEGLSDRRDIIIGAAVDAIWSEGASAWERYAVAPQDRPRWSTTREGRAWHAEVRDQGLIALTQPEEARVRGALEALGAHPLASTLRELGTPQVAWLWREPETDTLCRGITDLIVPPDAIAAKAPPLVVDIKTTAAGVGASEFAATATRLHYDVQAALYTDAIALLTADTPDWLWIVVSTRPPYRVEVYQASETILARGHDRYVDVLRRLRDADPEALSADDRSLTAYEPVILEWPRWDS